MSLYQKKVDNSPNVRNLSRTSSHVPLPRWHVMLSGFDFEDPAGQSSFNFNHNHPCHLPWSQPGRQVNRNNPWKSTCVLLTATAQVTATMRNEPGSLSRRVVQNASGSLNRQSRTRQRENATRRPSYRCSSGCQSTFSMKWVKPYCFTFSLMRNGPQIFSLVRPRDLLHISWTDKSFNEFLTNRSSRHVWQASFEGIPEKEQPPPCPSGMTEIAYANLVYGRYCMVCVSVFCGPGSLTSLATTELC